MSPAEMIAGVFHATYETLAPEHGYETRKASSVDWDNVRENNKTMMIASVQSLLDSAVVRPGPLALHVTARSGSASQETPV